ncbi:hypothetical protein D9M71_830950 [compost metagenome]
MYKAIPLNLTHAAEINLVVIAHWHFNPFIADLEVSHAATEPAAIGIRLSADDYQRPTRCQDHCRGLFFFDLRWLFTLDLDIDIDVRHVEVRQIPAMRRIEQTRLMQILDLRGVEYPGP